MIDPLLRYAEEEEEEEAGTQFSHQVEAPSEAPLNKRERQCHAQATALAN